MCRHSPVACHVSCTVNKDLKLVSARISFGIWKKEFFLVELQSSSSPATPLISASSACGQVIDCKVMVMHNEVVLRKTPQI